MFSAMQTDLWLSQTNFLRSKELIACWQIYTRVPFESKKLSASLYKQFSI